MSNPNFQKRILFVGIPDMAYICLDGLNSAGLNIVGVLGPKKNHPTYRDFKNFVQSRKLNFIEYDDLKDDFFIKKIKNLNADIAVVCSFNYKIPKVLLESTKDGFINVHPSLLPNYRGKNPYSSVIINEEKFTGVSLHFMDEDFDTGDIITQEKLPIVKNETMGTLFNKLNLLGFQLLLKTLFEYENKPLKSVKQPEGTFIEGKDYTNENSYIDFNNSAKKIECFTRALNPFLLATTIFRQTMVKIYAAEVIEEKSEIDNTIPFGTITKIEENSFYIKTSEGLLSPTVLQFGSFFIGSAKDFIKTLNIKIGEKFE